MAASTTRSPLYTLYTEEEVAEFAAQLDSVSVRDVDWKAVFVRVKAPGRKTVKLLRA